MSVLTSFFGRGAASSLQYLALDTEFMEPITFNFSQTDLFGEPSADLSQEVNSVVELVKTNLYEMVERMIERAKKGDVSAARLLLTVLPKMVKDMEEVDIWQLLREDDAARKK